MPVYRLFIIEVAPAFIKPILRRSCSGKNADLLRRAIIALAGLPIEGVKRSRDVETTRQGVRLLAIVSQGLHKRIKASDLLIQDYIPGFFELVDVRGLSEDCSTAE